MAGALLAHFVLSDDERDFASVAVRWRVALEIGSVGGVWAWQVIHMMLPWFGSYNITISHEMVTPCLFMLAVWWAGVWPITAWRVQQELGIPAWPPDDLIHRFCAIIGGVFGIAILLPQVLS